MNCMISSEYHSWLLSAIIAGWSAHSFDWGGVTSGEPLCLVG